MNYYVVFGDSITYGEKDFNGGWVQYLREWLKKDWVYNLGIDGDNSDGLVNRLEEELKRRRYPGHGLVVIIAIGKNDSAWVYQKKQCWVPLDRYRKNLLELVKQAKKYAPKIILVGPGPVDETKTALMPGEPDLTYKNDLLKQYSQIAKKAAETEQVKFVDLFNQLPPEYIKTLADGAHPDAAGHRLIFKLIRSLN